MKVYEYGALAPVGNLKRVQDQMSLAHKYYNTLVEIENNRRKVTSEAMSTFPELAKLEERSAQLEADVEAKREGMSKGRQKTRSMPKDPASKEAERASKAEIKATFALLKTVRASLREARALAKVDPVIQASIAASNERASEVSKQARAVSGVFWGSYLQVEQAVETAKNTSKMPTVRFKRWSGEGHLAVQIQNGMDTAVMHEGNTRVWIEPVDERAWSRGSNTPRPRGEGRRSFQKTVVHMRVGSEGRAPIFADIPIMMHRPLPPGKIKWAHLLRRRVADHEQWFVQFVVDEAPVAAADAAPGMKRGQGTVGIDVGWRLLENGDLRVAMARDQFGGQRELRLPARLISKDEHHQGLQALRSRTFDEAKLEIIAWTSTLPKTPEPLLHIHMWRDPGRIVRLLKTQSEALELASKKGLTEEAASRGDDGYVAITKQFDDVEIAIPAVTKQPAEAGPAPAVVVTKQTDESVPFPPRLFERLQAFVKQDLHLWQWQEHERLKVRRQRREMFRLFVVELARTYDTICIEDFDLREVAERGPVEDGATTDARRHNYLRTFACVSGLRGELENACAARGVELVKAPAEFTTLACHACGVVDKAWGDAGGPSRSIEHTCPACGVTWDQDVNAALNLLGWVVETKPERDRAAQAKAEASAALAATAGGSSGLSVRQTRFRKRTPKTTVGAAE